MLASPAKGVGARDAVTEETDVDGFPVNSDGIVKELGLELTHVRGLRVGFEAGYAQVPVKPPIDPSYTFYAPTTALGGNYGGFFGTLTTSFWW